MSSVTSYWLAFFRDTGLPEHISKKYAVMFSNERIDPSMLGELSKDILKDIGITTMGDIISILRHARATLDKDTQDKALEGVVRATPAGRTIAHYVGANSKRKEVIQFGSSNSPNAGLDKNDLPPLRRRVTPEIEGSYKVIMPKGTTPKTRAILQAIAESKKEKGRSMVADRTSNRSVFDRLAANNSNTDTSKMSKVNFSSQRIQSPADDDGSSSIFRRLGPRNVHKEQSPENFHTTTKYAGVLKLTAGSKRRAGDRNSGFSIASPEKRLRMMMDRKNVGGVIRAEATSTTQMKSEGIFSRSGTGFTSLPVKQRLGLKSSAAVGKPVRTVARPVSALRSYGRAKGVKTRLGVKTGGANW